MADLTVMSLTAGALAMLGYLAQTEFENWRRRRRLARIERIEGELAQTQRRLEALALEHQAWLQAQAHETRKALIMESFHASRDARNIVNHHTQRS